jgi:hypothetical protein
LSSGRDERSALSVFGEQRNRRNHYIRLRHLSAHELPSSPVTPPPPLVALFLDRLEALDSARLIYVKDLRTDTKVYRAAKVAVEEAAKREPDGAAGLVEAQRRAREIVRSKAHAGGWNFGSAVIAAEDAVAGLYFRYISGDLSARLYRPFDPVIPHYDLWRQEWEQTHPEAAAKEKGEREAAVAAKEADRARAVREAPIHWDTVISFMGEDLVAVGIGAVLAFGVNWQVGALIGAVCFLALKWGTGPQRPRSVARRLRSSIARMAFAAGIVPTPGVPGTTRQQARGGDPARRSVRRPKSNAIERVDY